VVVKVQRIPGRTTSWATVESSKRDAQGGRSRGVMKIEKILDEALECNECGEVGCPRTVIWLDHLCTHFIAFCHECYPEFVELIGENEH